MWTSVKKNALGGRPVFEILCASGLVNFKSAHVKYVSYTCVIRILLDKDKTD